jgi:hypothetical protein
VPSSVYRKALPSTLAPLSPWVSYSLLSSYLLPRRDIEHRLCLQNILSHITSHVALALRHTLSSAIIMSASVQAPDPLVLNDPATLGTGLLASGKHTPRDSIDTNGRSHSRGTSQANTLDRTASPSPPSQVSTDSMSNGKPTSPSNIEHSNAMLNGNAQAPQTVSSKDPKAAAQAASDMRNIVRRKLTGYVGFANLPNQWHRKSVRKGFNFNVMVVGEYNLHLIEWRTAS